MGLYNNIPVFLDENSGYSKSQVEKINTIVRTARNRFTSIATQSTNELPKIKKFITAKYNRVLNLRDYLFDKNFSISFILDPAGFAPGLEFPLFEFEGTIMELHCEGSNSSDYPAATLSSLGYLRIDTTKNIIYFKCVNDWPVDSGGNKVNYSVYIGGAIE